MVEKDTPLSGEALFAAVFAWQGSYWDAHNNAACRHERDRALQLQHIDEGAERANPQVLKVWLRYRSENISVLTGLRLKANQAQRK